MQTSQLLVHNVFKSHGQLEILRPVTGHRTVLERKSKTRNQQHWRRFFEFYQHFIYNFLCQTVRNFSLYILPKALTNWLTQFCVTGSFISDLAYTNYTKLISLLNLNYKMELKYINTMNFLRTNSPPLYLFPS